MCTHTKIESLFLSDGNWLNHTAGIHTHTHTHCHTRLYHMLSASVITDLTSFLHVKAVKPFARALSLSLSHTHTHTHTHTHRLTHLQSSSPIVFSKGNCWRAEHSLNGEILIGTEQQERAEHKSCQFRGQLCGSEIPLLSKSRCDVMRQLDVAYYPKEN